MAFCNTDMDVTLSRTDLRAVAAYNKEKAERRLIPHSSLKIELASEKVLEKDWDNEYDERWNKY